MKHRYLDGTRDHVTKEAISHSATKLVPPGTVLVVVKSKVLANRLPVAVTRVRTCFGQDLKGIVAGPHTHAEFIAGALRVGQDWLLARTRGINTEGLTLGELRRFPVPTASPRQVQDFVALARGVEEQRKISAQSEIAADALFASPPTPGISG